LRKAERSFVPGYPCAVLPNGIELIRDVLGEAGEVGIAIAVTIALQDEVFRVKVLLTGGHSDIDHVVEYDKTSQMGSRRSREGTIGPQRELGKVRANLQVMRGDRVVVVDDGTKQR
jgi:hypothetical protein